MKMEAQFIINVLGGIVMTGLGWILRELWSAVKSLRSDLQRIEVALPTNYVQRNDLDARMKHIEDMFQRIYDKLDTKADKP
jgi:hypothetical protein